MLILVDAWFLILIKIRAASSDIVQATAEKYNSSTLNNFIFIIVNGVNYKWLLMKEDTYSLENGLTLHLIRNQHNIQETANRNKLLWIPRLKSTGASVVKGCLKEKLNNNGEQGKRGGE